MSIKPNLDDYDGSHSGDDHMSKVNLRHDNQSHYDPSISRANKVYPVRVLDPEGNLKFWWSGSVLNATTSKRLEKSKASRKLTKRLHKTAHYTLRKREAFTRS